jgi:hypothetical protein
MEVFEYLPNKDLIKFKENDKIVNYDIINEIYKGENFRFCEIRKRILNIIKNNDCSNESNFNFLFNCMNFELFFKNDKFFPFKNSDKVKYIVIIKNDDKYKFLDVVEGKEFLDSIRLLYKLKG